MKKAAHFGCTQCKHFSCTQCKHFDFSQCKQRGIIHPYPLIMLAGLGLLIYFLVAQTFPFKDQLLNILYPKPTGKAQTAPTTFLETFNGAPPNPQPWNPANWAVDAHFADHNTYPGSFKDAPVTDVDHGSDCGPPPAMHTVSTVAESVFLCRDHLMTFQDSIPYGMTYLTAPAMVDFSQTEATIKLDVSTFRTSTRDWWDIWVTPYEDLLMMPLEEVFPDGVGIPRRSITARVDNFKDSYSTGFSPDIINNFKELWLQKDTLVYEDYMKLDPKRRDTFEMKISKTHFKFCLVSINYSANSPGPNGETSPKPVNICWIDETAPFRIDTNQDGTPDSTLSEMPFNQGVVQIGHHSYNPRKGEPSNSRLSPRPTTWHWDNLSISPSIPLTIIRGDKLYVSANTSSKVITFNQPAPAQAHLQFEAWGNIELSFNQGATWSNAQQPSSSNPSPGLEKSRQYRHPVPQGVSSVMIRGTDPAGTGRIWLAQNFSILSRNQPSGTPPPVPTPTPVVPTPTPTPTMIPTPTPTPSPAPSPTPTPQPTGSTLGKTTIGPNTDSSNSNYMNATKVTMGSTSKTVKSMSVHVGSVDISPNNQFQVAIYTHNATTNAPGNLVAKSQSGTLIANSWNTVSISTTLQANQTYWLLYNTNGRSSGVNNLHYSDASSARSAWQTASQPFNTWLQTFGPITRQNVIFSMYVRFTQ